MLMKVLKEDLSKIYQSWNYISEGTKWQVDLCCLFHSVASCTSFASTLWACQIHQVQFWSLIFFISFIIILLRVDVYGEDRMWSWWLSVHISGPSGSALEANLHVMLHFLDGVYLYLQQILHKHALVRWLLQVHACFGILAQKIVDLFVVNFDETATDQVSLGCIVLGYCYYLTESSGNDSSRLLGLIATHHCVGLTTTRLTIGKNGAIVAIQYVIY